MVQKASSSDPKSRSILLVSCVIAGTILIQSILTFRVLCPNWLLTFTSRNVCGSALYPFMDYPMYSDPRYEGEKIDQFIVWGIAEDSTEVVIKPEDVNLNIFQFREHFIEPIINGDAEKIDKAVQFYDSVHDQKLSGLRLENQGLILTREGVQEAPIEVLKTIQF